MDNPGTDDERSRRAGENQALFRSINERIEELNEAFDQFGGYGRWTCECPDVHCTETIEMTLAEYEAVRAHPTRFAIAPSVEHLRSEIEIVLSRTDRYWVVEKMGPAGERAEELDES